MSSLMSMTPFEPATVSPADDFKNAANDNHEEGLTAPGHAQTMALMHVENLRMMMESGQTLTLMQMKDIAEIGGLFGQTYDPAKPCPYNFSGP
jgi:hypothetical protein